jgi:hypothetical protein
MKLVVGNVGTGNWIRPLTNGADDTTLIKNKLPVEGRDFTDNVSDNIEFRYSNLI